MGMKAHIRGQVQYREGDGANISIRPGPCEIEETELDATISWTDGQTHGSAAIPISDFKRLLAAGAIEFVEAPRP